MSIQKFMRTSADRVIARFTKYLNGPLGRTVLDSLAEGESFIMQTSEYRLLITKSNDRAVVSLA
ncbi:MAG: hypothetical protein RTU92_03140 [Candidatus Thorarchaeota archaeon]